MTRLVRQTMVTRRSLWNWAAIAAIGTLHGTAKAQGSQRNGMAGATVSLASTDSDPVSIRIVSDLAAALRDSSPRILPVVGQGPVRNIGDLLSRQDLTAALIPSDVLPYLSRMDRLPEASQSLRYIAALYRQEMHVLALTRFTRIADLAGLPVNFGAPDSTTYITGSTIFDSLNVRVQPTLLDQASALDALRQRRIAALVTVARKPAPLFFALNQTDGVHFLAVPSTPDLSRIYLPSQLTIADYPLLIGEGEAGRGKPIPTLAVPVVIAIRDAAPGTERYRNLSLLVDVLFPFAAASHKEVSQDSVWAEFDPGADVPGWRRFAPALARLQGKPVGVGAETPARPAQRRAGAPAGQSEGPHPPQEDREKLFEEFLRWRQGQNHSQ
jgi:hypothetical protein